MAFFQDFPGFPGPVQTLVIVYANFFTLNVLFRDVASLSYIILLTERKPVSGEDLSIETLVFLPKFAPFRPFSAVVYNIKWTSFYV